MPKKEDYENAAREREAREKGKSLPHYARKVAKRLVSPRKRGKSTPSKKG